MKNVDDERMTVTEPDLSYENYTYADYLLWTIEERFELIKGKVFKMSPAPNTAHQRVAGNLHGEIRSFLKGKNCDVFIAPFDVRLPRKSKEDKDIITVVQPDVCVMCDSSKIDEKGCVGAPDIVVEILSPGNNRKELSNKYEVYEESGVKEYWIIHPQEKTFMKNILVDGKYQPTKLLTLGDTIHTNLLSGFELAVDEIFDY